MDQYKNVEARKKNNNTNKLSSSVSDIDQLCNLIDESTFGLKTLSSSKFSSVPSHQVKAFRSSRLKRLRSSSVNKSNINGNESASLFRSMHLSLSSSLLKRFRSLSTHNPSQIRRSSSPTITVFEKESFPSLINGEQSKSSILLSSSSPPVTTTTTAMPVTSSSTTTITTTTPSIQSQLSCTLVDTCRTTANSCNVEELAAYLDNFLYLPKSLSGAAELMYT